MKAQNCGAKRIKRIAIKRNKIGMQKTVKKEIGIDIPAGIDRGMVIKMEGEGNAGIGTKARGDLYIKFNIPREEK
jgi:DnaJ-class molecular chaperone